MKSMLDELTSCLNKDTVGARAECDQRNLSMITRLLCLMQLIASFASSDDDVGDDDDDDDEPDENISITLINKINKAIINPASIFLQYGSTTITNCTCLARLIVGAKTNYALEWLFAHSLGSFVRLIFYLFYLFFCALLSFLREASVWPPSSHKNCISRARARRESKYISINYLSLIQMSREDKIWLW